MSFRQSRSESRAEVNRLSLETEHLMADLGRRTARGGAIAITAQLAKVAIRVGTIAILARLLQPSDFGLVAMATVVTGFAGLFTDLGLSTATVQRSEIDQDTVSALFIMNLILGLVIMAVVITLAPVAAWLFHDPRMRVVVMALALPIPMLAVSRQHAAILQRGMRWISIEWTAIAAQAVGAGLAMFLAWRADFGYWALVAQGWTVAFLTTFLLWIVCPWRPSWVRDWRHAWSAFQFGMHLTGFNIVAFLNRQLDDAMIGWRWGATDLGYYNRAYALLTLPLHLINNPTSSAIVPALSRMQGEPTRWRDAYLEALGLVSLISSGLAAVLIVTAEPLVTVLYGPGWSETARIFTFLAVSIFTSIPTNAMGWIYISLGRTKRLFLWSLIRLPIVITAFAVGLPYGAKGVAVAFSVVEIGIFLPAVVFALHGTPLKVGKFLRVVGPFITVGIIATAGGMFFSNEISLEASLFSLCVCASLTGILYLSGIAIIFIFDNDSRRMVLKFFKIVVNRSL